MPPKITTARPSKSVANEQQRRSRQKKRQALLDQVNGIYTCDVCGTLIELVEVTAKGTPIFKHKFIDSAAKFQAHFPIPEGENHGSAT
jgi:hypothetical protein